MCVDWRVHTVQCACHFNVILQDAKHLAFWDTSFTDLELSK